MRSEPTDPEIYETAGAGISLEQRLVDLGLTQSDLIARVKSISGISIDRSQMSRYVSGDFRPRAKRARAIEEALQMEPGTLYPQTAALPAQAGQAFPVGAVMGPVTGGMTMFSVNQRIPVAKALRILAILAEEE